MTIEATKEDMEKRKDKFPSISEDDVSSPNREELLNPIDTTTERFYPSNQDFIIEEIYDISNRINIVVNPLEVPTPTGSQSSPEENPSPGDSQISPPPSYQDIPGTVPAHQGTSRGPPPSYEDAVDPNAEPPSYDSLFGRLRSTHKRSRNVFDFLANVLILLIGTIGCTMVCGISIVIPLLAIFIGSVFFRECPAEPNIPVFLIVGGSLSIFKYLIGVFIRNRTTTTIINDDNEEEEVPRTHPAQSLITCFLCGWFITGCVWVYRIYRPHMEDEFRGDPHYCSKTVYVFAFWLITTAYIFLGLFTSCICCLSIASVFIKRNVN